MTTPYVVIVQLDSLRLATAPAADGHPEAGVLFHAPADAPVHFASEADAEAAIAWTLAWAAAHGYGWRREDYGVWPLALWDEERMAPRRRRAKAAAGEPAA